jgi:hypothetical protein
MNKMGDNIVEITELSFDEPGTSSNFGSGIELLMNDKVTNGRTNTNIRMEDVNDLENELNDLAKDLDMDKPKTDFFRKSSNVSFTEPSSSNADLGRATMNTDTPTHTWDGYGKFNNVPIHPDHDIPIEPKLSNAELANEKFKYIKKLEALEKKGVELSKKYTMESSLDEMKSEFDTLMEQKAKEKAVKIQGQWLLSCINTLEYLNTTFDPFDLTLDGWSEQVQENITDYDDIFEELYEKYKGKASLAPEIRLIFQLGLSGGMIHMTNRVLKTSMPGMDDILRQNPDLMKSFQNATVNSMSQSAPGFSGFMSNIMNPAPSGGARPSGPPPPLATQGPAAVPTPAGRGGNNDFARQVPLPPAAAQNRPRPEMNGPSDLSSILSGLKTKTINIQEQPSNDNSTVSISELKDLQMPGNMPKRSGRRKKSNSNTVSLDI